MGRAARRSKQRSGRRWRHVLVSGFSPNLSDADIVDTIVIKINSCKADFLFLCFGCPGQERLAVKLIKQLSNVSIMIINAGGTVDFVSGSIKRAPVFIRKCCLEGAYRFIKQPSAKRFIRIITTVEGLIQFVKDMLIGIDI